MLPDKAGQHFTSYHTSSNPYGRDILVPFSFGIAYESHDPGAGLARLYLFCRHIGSRAQVKSRLLKTWRRESAL
jgi:hypothetical protein